MKVKSLKEMFMSGFCSMIVYVNVFLVNIYLESTLFAPSHFIKVLIDVYLESSIFIQTIFL